MDALTLAERADELEKETKALRKEFTKTAWQIIRVEEAAIPDIVQMMRQIAHDVECLEAVRSACHVGIKEERQKKHEEMTKSHEQAKEERRIRQEEMLKAHEQAKTSHERQVCQYPPEVQETIRKVQEGYKEEAVKLSKKVQSLKDRQALDQAEQLEKARQILLQVRQNPMERPPSVVMIESGSYKARSCFPKIQYKDMGQADKAMNLLLMSGSADDRSAILCEYQCGECGFFHTGHDITKEKI